MLPMAHATTAGFDPHPGLRVRLFGLKPTRARKPGCPMPGRLERRAIATRHMERATAPRCWMRPPVRLGDPYWRRRWRAVSAGSGRTPPLRIALTSPWIEARWTPSAPRPNGAPGSARARHHIGRRVRRSTSGMAAGDAHNRRPPDLRARDAARRPGPSPERGRVERITLAARTLGRSLSAPTTRRASTVHRRAGVARVLRDLDVLLTRPWQPPYPLGVLDLSTPDPQRSRRRSPRSDSPRSSTPRPSGDVRAAGMSQSGLPLAGSSARSATSDAVPVVRSSRRQPWKDRRPYRWGARDGPKPQRSEGPAKPSAPRPALGAPRRSRDAHRSTVTTSAR